MTIDITKPLELSDGTPIVEAQVDYEGDIEVFFAHNGWCFFKPNGEPVSNWRKEANGRTLRNVKEATAMKTGEEQLQRMIVAELDKGKGPQGDALEAEKIVANAIYGDHRGIVFGSDEARLVEFAALGIAKGRKLALAELRAGVFDNNVGMYPYDNCR